MGRMKGAGDVRDDDWRGGGEDKGVWGGGKRAERRKEEVELQGGHAPRNNDNGLQWPLNHDREGWVPLAPLAAWWSPRAAIAVAIGTPLHHSRSKVEMAPASNFAVAPSNLPAEVSQRLGRSALKGESCRVCIRVKKPASPRILPQWHESSPLSSPPPIGTPLIHSQTPTADQTTKTQW